MPLRRITQKGVFAAVALVVTLGMHFCVLHFFPSDAPPPRVLEIDFSAVTRSILATTRAVGPADYMDVVRSALPALRAHKALPTPVADLKDAAHFVLQTPVYLDTAGCIWIRDEKGADLGQLLRQEDAYSRQAMVTTQRVRFVYWSASQDGTWMPSVVAQEDSKPLLRYSPKGDATLTLARSPQDYLWESGFAWGDFAAIPTRSGVSIFDAAHDWKEIPSPVLCDLAADSSSAPVHILLDGRGLLAWVPPSVDHPGGTSVARFVDGGWTTLDPAAGFGEGVIYLVPLQDGSVLQIRKAVSKSDGDDAVALKLVAIDPPRVDEKKIRLLIEQLGDPLPRVREEAQASLGLMGASIAPIIRQLRDENGAEVRARIDRLLAIVESPTLGGMRLVTPRMKLVSELPDRGAVFFARDGVNISTDDGRDAKVAPAWIIVRPGMPIRLLDWSIDGRLIATLDPARHFLTGWEGNWFIGNDEAGLHQIVGDGLVPVLPPELRHYAWLVGIDHRGRWILRNTKSDDTETLIVDPTLADPTPRFPVWLIGVLGQTVGWDANDWPARKSDAAWALEAAGWRAMQANEPLLTELPATAPAGDLLLTTPDGMHYSDGIDTLSLQTRTGKAVSWNLPESAKGDGSKPTLIVAGDGTLFLYNRPGALQRIRYEPDAVAPFVLEATFTANIPTGAARRIWLDKAGRICIATSDGELAVCFPTGRVPAAIARQMPPLPDNETQDDNDGLQ